MAVAVVEVMTVGGQIFKHRNTEWKDIDGKLVILDAETERYSVYAKGQWVRAVDLPSKEES